MLNRPRRHPGAVLFLVVLVLGSKSAHALEPPRAVPSPAGAAILQLARDPAVPRSLSDVRALALAESPRLAEARARLAQAEAERRETGLYPNPVLNIEGEEYPRNFSTGPGLTMFTINRS